MEGFIIAFLLWTLFAFGAGIVVHWWATRKQRRLLKQYRSRDRMLRQLNRPIE
jgi:hypothetical protein